VISVIFASVNVIELYEVIQQIDTGEPFNMTYVTADRKKGTGGQIRHCKNWVRCDLATMPEPVLRRNKVYEVARDPRHQEHKTKNIMNPATRDIRKVHIRLITEFNGRRVV
jgi:hypothetical protein